MLNRKTKYAIQALLNLADHSGLEPRAVSELAEQEAIPRKFLEVILLELKNGGILQSRKGKSGGYVLSRPPQEITLGEVVRLMEGPLAPVPCVSHTAYRKCDECRDERTCGIRLVMKDVRDAIAGILDSTSLADVQQRASEAVEERDEVPMYYI